MNVKAKLDHHRSSTSAHSLTKSCGICAAFLKQTAA